MPTFTIDQIADTVTITGTLSWVDLDPNDFVTLRTFNSTYTLTIPYSASPFDPGFVSPGPINGGNGSQALPGTADIIAEDPKFAADLVNQNPDTAFNISYGLYDVPTAPPGFSAQGLIFQDMFGLHDSGGLDGDQTYSFVVGMNADFTEVENVNVVLRIRNPIYGTDIIVEEFYHGSDTPPGGPVEISEIQALNGIFDPLGAGDDVLDLGQSTANLTVEGYAGNDEITTGSGNDSVRGGTGWDTLTGGAGDDTLQGQGGWDSFVGNDGNDVINADAGNDTVDAGPGDDTVTGGGQNDILNGGPGADLIRGGNGRDVVNGDDGNDRLLGGFGGDTLNGGNGDDNIRGENGLDIISGGPGNDLLRGEGQSDRFDFADGFGNDTILDFDANDDGERIDLSSVTAITDFADLMANHASQAGSRVIIDDGAGNTIRLDGVALADLDPVDFLF